jgi:hypothetical protein
MMTEDASGRDRPFDHDVLAKVTEAASKNVEPQPGFDSTQIRPPCMATISSRAPCAGVRAAGNFVTVFGRGSVGGNKIVSDNCAAAFATNDKSILITIGYTRCAQAARTVDYAATMISCII